jgi:hypothetical protein
MYIYIYTMFLCPLMVDGQTLSVFLTEMASEHV